MENRVTSEYQWQPSVYTLNYRMQYDVNYKAIHKQFKLISKLFPLKIFLNLIVIYIFSRIYCALYSLLSGSYLSFIFCFLMERCGLSMKRTRTIHF